MRRLTTSLLRPVSGSLLRQVGLLLALAAALAGFFLLLDFLISLAATGPRDILTVNPSPKEYVGLPNSAALFKFAIVVVSIALAVAIFISLVGWPVRRASFRPSRSLAVAGFAAIVLIGTGVFLAFSGLLVNDISYEQHSVQRSLLQSWGLLALGMVFLSITVAAVISRKLLVLVLAAWLAVAIVFGFRDTKSIDGLLLFERTARLESPVAFTELVAQHRQENDPSLEEAPTPTPEPSPTPQPSKAPDPTRAPDPILVFDAGVPLGAEFSRGRTSDSEAVFSVSSEVPIRFLRTAAGDIYSDGSWTQRDQLNVPLDEGDVVPDAVIDFISRLNGGGTGGIPGHRLDPLLPASPIATAVETDVGLIEVSAVGRFAGFPPGVVPISNHVASVSLVGTFDAFSGTFNIPNFVRAYEWQVAVPRFAVEDIIDAGAASDPEYLKLPNGLPDHIYDLAVSFDDGSTPFLKASLIQTYLREEYAYGPAGPGTGQGSPPGGGDPVDWFLSGQEAGSSRIVSSAFVVLARASGIPSRVVSGWSIEERLGTQIVYSDQTYQWAEIALEGVGWVTFDPARKSHSAPEVEDDPIEEALTDLATNTDVLARVAAAELLGQHEDPVVLLPLVEASVNDESHAVREAASAALQDLGLDWIVRVLQNHEEPLVRAAAATTLGLLGDLRAMDPLLEALTSDPAPEVRSAAAWALGEIKNNAALPQLFNARFEDGSRVVRSAAEDALNKWDRQGLEQVLEKTEDHEQRAAAAGILGDRGNIASIAALGTALSDPHKAVREAAAQALPQLGDLHWLENGGGWLTLTDSDSSFVPSTTTGRAFKAPHSAVFQVQGAAHTSLLRTAVGDMYVDGHWVPVEDTPLPYDSHGEPVIHSEIRPTATADNVFTDWIRIDGAWSGQQFVPGFVPTSSHLETLGAYGSFWPTWATFSISSPTDDYTWTSLVHDYSQEQLQAAQEWTTSDTQPYLDLPDWMPAGPIGDLALDITAGQTTAYAKAKAIERHLKSEYTYRFAETPEETGPPAGQDPVHWFLFEEREGTCGNFSSAFVVLARAAGIPARVVSGWAVGETEDSQTVHMDQAHQWAEVALEGLGWVTFDPTPGGATLRAPGPAPATGHEEIKGLLEGLSSTDPAAQEAAREELRRLLSSISSNPPRGLGALAGVVPAVSGDSAGIDLTPEEEALDALKGLLNSLAGADSTGVAAGAGLKALEVLANYRDGYDPVLDPLAELLDALAGEGSTVRESVSAILSELSGSSQRLVELENGGLVATDGSGVGGLVPGTSAFQATMPPHIPAFDVEGAAHTGHLRTTVGDLYEGGNWRQLDAVDLPYTPGSNLPDTVKEVLLGTERGPASLTDRQIRVALLAGPTLPPERVERDNIQLLPTGVSNHLPSGRVPTSRTMEYMSHAGSFDPFSATFSLPGRVESYSWISTVSYYSQEQLTPATPVDDPAYTQLPDDMPDRIRELALSITSEYTTAYSKARAIERHLKTEYTYGFAESPEDGLPPPGRDAVDWFLFDEKVGTCGTFSSAFAVLARAAGIPARVVSGWVVAPTNNLQTVYLDQAHQWAEVALEGLGWIAFEPTASGSAPYRLPMIEDGSGGGDGSSGGDIPSGNETPPVEEEIEPIPLLQLDTVTVITEWSTGVRRQEPFTVRGTVLTESGLPVSGMEVEIYVNETKEHGGIKIGTTVAVLGRFEAEVQVPASLDRGAYQLLARAVENERYEESWSDPDISVLSGSGLVLTGPSDVAVDTEAVFVGKVSEDTGEALPDNEVAVTIDGKEADPILTDSSGQFTFSRSFTDPGSHWVEVEIEKQDFLLNSRVRLDFEVTLPTNTTVIVPASVKVGEEFQVIGQVRDVRGQPIVGENLSIQVADGEELSATTDDLGQVAFTASVDSAGEFPVLANFRANGPMLQSQGRASSAAWHTVGLTMEGPGRIEQGAGAQFSGRLVSASLATVSQLDLIIENAIGDLLTTVTADGEGRFEYNHTSFGITGPGSLTARHPGGEYIEASIARASYLVLAPASLSLSGPSLVQEGEVFEITGVLLMSGDLPVPNASVEASGVEFLSLVTDAEGRFTWEVSAALDLGLLRSPFESVVVMEAMFTGTEHLASAHAELKVVVGSPRILAASVPPVARGDATDLQGTVMLGNRPMPGVGLSIGSVAEVQSGELGAFIYRHEVPSNAPLGITDVTISAASLGTQVSVPIHVKSEPSLIIAPVDKVRPGRLVILQAALTDDEGTGIPEAVLRTSQGVEAVTDETGIALIELTVPDSEDLEAVPITFSFEGDDIHMPLSYFLGIPVTPAGFNWLLWVATPGVIALVAATGYAGRKSRMRALPDLIRRTKALVPMEAELLDDVVVVEIEEEEAVVELQPAQLAIGFTKSAPDLPDVWGIGEQVSARIRLTDTQEQAVRGAVINLLLSDGGPASQLKTDHEGVCTLEWTGSESGEHLLSAEFLGDGEYLADSGSQSIRIVDFREEIVSLYNAFLDWAREKSPGIGEQSTPREVELLLVSEGLPVSQKSLDEVISRFEEADYSEHPISRRHYETMYRAWRQVTGA